MNRYLSLALAVLCAVSCGNKTSIDMTVEGAPSTALAVYKLNASSSELLDSVKTDSHGRFRYNVKVEKGQPEFVYIYDGDTRLASLLLESGQKVVVDADTTGKYSVSGSEGSSELCEVEKDYNAFLHNMMACEDDRSAVSTYLAYYRSRVKYVMSHSKSLSVIPVFYQVLSPGVPVFSQPTDAVLFRSVCDSLKTVYPDSRFVRALDVDAKNRERQLGLSVTLSQAQEVGFPELNMPDVNAKKVSLAGIKSKAILVHFWSDGDNEQVLFNTDVLKPLYEKYHSRGLEIYSVCLSMDKALWASIVKNQKLPWVNVCDGKGVTSPAVTLYNVTTLPYSVLIFDGEISSVAIKGERDLRARLDKILN
ncbi:MAG TPA: hypothetical protein DHU75_01715 [Rikenellaceae bacterium]|nr:hypothetical protein [Rikenellaceae bacterium]